MRKKGCEQVQRVEQILHGEEAQKSSNLMGSNKFRLSNMLPNSWLHKLKNMTKPKPKPKSHTTSSHTPTKKIHPQFTSHRHSYYFTSDRLLHNSPINPPRKSTKRNSTTRRRRTINDKSKSKSSSSSTSAKLVVTSSASPGCDCRASLESVRTQTYPTPECCATRLGVSSEPNTLNKSVLPEFGPDPDMVGSWSSSCSCRVGSFDTDIIIEEFDLVSGLELPPILTKPVKFNDMVSEIKMRNDVQEEKQRFGSVKVSAKEETIKTRKEQRGSPQTRRISTYSTGLKLRSNTPRMKCRKTVSSAAKERRKSLSDSFAIVKSSRDPQRDFRESMVEMIVENNIRASKDLEELLAYYLCLNSDEYHDIIVRVFEQIWFDLTDIQL